jgi:putative salt-induced outer membrane protein YdiY
MFDTVTLLEKAEYFVNSEIKSTTALSIPVRNALSAQLAFDYDRQEKVPAGRKQTDTATRVALVYSF